MKLLLALALVCLVGSVVAEEDFVAPIELDYHNAIGIPAAARIKAAEEALDFHDARIIGGEAASLGQYPYFGGVLITLNTGVESVCGCSLLTHTRAVFAAHCVTYGRTNAPHGVEYTAVFGSTYLYSGGTRRTTKQVKMHSLYNGNTLANDIALLYFSWVPYSDNIHNISLACGTDQFVGTWAWTAGFGQTSDAEKINSYQILSHVQVQVITNTKCKAIYGSKIRDSNICVASDDGRGTCGGDSGGSLVANGQLIGITSFIIKGCELGYPKAYSRVTSFASWIKNHL